MKEIRGKVESLEIAQRILVELGAKNRGDYEFTDIIYGNYVDYKKADERVRLMLFSNNNRGNILAKIFHKKRQGDKWKTVNKWEFEKLMEGKDFMRKTFPYFIEYVSYSRKGIEYVLGSSLIFLEDIKGFGPTVEVESDDKHTGELAAKLGIKEYIKESMADIMIKNAI